MSSNEVSLSRPIGVVVMKDEPTELILIKFLGWIIVMTLFVILLISVSDYFKNPSNNNCYRNLDGFLLKQERTDTEFV